MKVKTNIKSGGATIPSSTPAQPPFTFNITYSIRVE